MPELLTVHELATRLRLRPATIKKWVKEGLIPAIRPSPKVLRFDWTEVRQALQRAAPKSF